MKFIYDLSLTSSSSSSSSPSFAFTLFKVFNFDHFDIIMQKEYCNEYECELVYSYWKLLHCGDFVKSLTTNHQKI